MNYDLIILRNAVRMRWTAKSLAKELENIALASYDTLNWRDGTMGQIRTITDISAQIAECKLFNDIVFKALSAVPDGYRELLIAVYFKNVSADALADRYRVSRSTVYRRLRRARNLFAESLSAVGCTEEWFVTHYGHYDFCSCITKNTTFTSHAK